MPIKIFIAAPFDCKEEAEDISEKLQMMGCGVTSRWHRLGYKVESRSIAAVEDLEDVDACQVLLLLDRKLSRGKYHEAGYAQAKGKALIWWHNSRQPLDNFPVYACHPATISIYSWEDLFLELSRLVL